MLLSRNPKRILESSKSFTHAKGSNTSQTPNSSEQVESIFKVLLRKRKEKEEQVYKIYNISHLKKFLKQQEKGLNVSK